MIKNYDVFISYRRNGGFETARHLYDLLVHDGYDVSFDLDTLREGAFNKQLLTRIDECEDFLIVIDQHAFDRTLDPTFDPQKDWMRIELSYALKKEKNIVPVLLAGARFPENLPDDIRQVIYKNVPEYSLSYFDSFYLKLKTFLHSKPGIPITFHADYPCYVKEAGKTIAEVSVEGTTVKLINGEHRLLYERKDDSMHAYEENLLVKVSGHCQTVDISFASHFRKMTPEDAKQAEAFKQTATALMDDDDNIDRAVYYVKKAAELGDMEGQAMFALFSFMGADIQKGFQLLRPIQLLAEQGDAMAQYNLGMVCRSWDNRAQKLREDGVSEEAMKWFRLSAEQGNLDAMLALGNSYSDDNNPVEAVKWYKRAAELGKSQAQLALASCLFDGEGIGKDQKQAVYWYRRAAEQGLAYAQFRLGECYQDGSGVQKDIQEAKKWYRLAAQKDEYIKSRVQERLNKL